MAKTIRQTATIDAPPHAIYEALMDSAKHSAFTGALATVERHVGGRFSSFDGWASGTILELRKDSKIVETWRSEDFTKNDPDSHLTILLSRVGRRTRRSMVHANVPDGEYEALKRGWTDYYWTPLKRYLKE